MYIREELQKEIIARYGNGKEGLTEYEKLIDYYESAARRFYKKLCKVFNGDENRTNQCIVSEDECYFWMRRNAEEGKKILLFMFDLGITEKQGGGVVI